MSPLPDTVPSFHDRFVDLFEGHFHRLYRYLDRLSGEPELAADLAQETFVKLYRRGSLPDAPEAWLISVAMNLFRNVKSTRSRRRRLLTPSRGEAVHSDPPPSPDQAAVGEDTRRRVRAAIDRLPERERTVLALYYDEELNLREIGEVLGVTESRVCQIHSQALVRLRSKLTEWKGLAIDAE